MSLPVVRTTPDGRFKPQCPCGAAFWPYATRTAAQVIATAHHCTPKVTA